jgi:hypothetical protein
MLAMRQSERASFANLSARERHAGLSRVSQRHTSRNGSGDIAVLRTVLLIEACPRKCCSPASGNHPPLALHPIVRCQDRPYVLRSISRVPIV